MTDPVTIGGIAALVLSMASEEALKGAAKRRKTHTRP
jgi:hypothetical protein